MKLKNKSLTYSCRIKDPQSLYPQLEIVICPMQRFEEDDRPLPTWYDSYDKSGEVTVTWQCTRHETPRDTGRPKWYARKITWQGDQFSDTALLQRLARLCPDGIHDPDQLLEALDKAKGIQVAMSAQIGRYVDAGDWYRAESFRMYYDKGITTDGCVINAFAHQSASEEEITAIVTDALRKSRHCTADQLAAWIQGGRRWAAGNHEPRDGHRPATREAILGRPAPVEAPAELQAQPAAAAA